MEILEKGDMFVEKDGDYIFDHAKIILHGDNDEFYYAKSNQRNFGSSQIDIDGLTLNRIPADVWPLAEPTFTRAPNPLPSGCYLKRPSLLYYEDGHDRSDYGDQILGEVKACEVFRLRPHPNIARYLGCVVEDGRIKGLCFVRYPVTLSQMLKDGTRLQSSSICLRGIEAGVQHMHDLGFVHNDLNLSNIMMDGEDPIIIDFDSCKRVGDRLGAKSGTFGRPLAEEEFAQRENDLYSLSEIQATLTKRELKDGV
jgi:serine/threonine protein kinase